MLILEFSTWNAQVDNSEQIPRYKFSGNPGSNHVLVALHPNALPLCQVYLCFVTRQSSLFLLVYTCMVSVFFFDVAMLFFAFLLGMVSERLQIVSPRENFFQNKLCKLQLKTVLLSYPVSDCPVRLDTVLVRKQSYLMATNSCFLLSS